MDTKRACQILHVSEPIKSQDLKRAWRSAALKHHPDKSNDPNSDTRFIEVQEAYTFLAMRDKSHEGDEEYFIQELFHAMSESIFSDSGRQLILDIFQRLDRTKALRILKYAELFRIDEDVIANMRIIIEANSDVIIIRPTIGNLLQSDIYCLEHNGTIHYVPMWHHEVTYDRLIVRCVPELPPHMMIDEKGGIHVTVKTKASKVLEMGGVNFVVGGSSCFVPGDQLRCIKNQTYTFKSHGCPQINQIDAFDNSSRGNLIIHLELI